MAQVSRLSDVVKGAIIHAAAGLQEGLAVKLTQSGVINGVQQDLPIASGASTNDINVYVVMAAPDNFPRPVDSRQYRAAWYNQVGRTDGSFSDPLETVTRYNIGLSNLYNPVIPSGALAQCHRGGTYKLQNTSFISSAGIKVPGAMIRVGDGSKWEVTSTVAQAVGEVDNYAPDTDELTITLYQ